MCEWGNFGDAEGESGRSGGVKEMSHALEGGAQPLTFPPFAARPYKFRLPHHFDLSASFKVELFI